MASIQEGNTVRITLTNLTEILYSLCTVQSVQHEGYMISYKTDRWGKTHSASKQPDIEADKSIHPHRETRATVQYLLLAHHFVM